MRLIERVRLLAMIAAGDFEAQTSMLAEPDFQCIEQ
jgi:hypothetical protein